MDLHEFHVWALCENEKAISVHLETTGIEDEMVYNNAIEVCKNYGMHFYTIQIETKTNLCPLRSKTN